ncbi:erythrocyte membrane protein band 4.1 like 4a [Cricetulus griseus]
MGQAPAEAELNYLRTAKSLEMYGVDLHPVYCNETSFFFEARSKTACKHLWKCSVEHHTFFSGRTALQMSRDLSIQLPRPNQNVVRSRSKTYPKRVAQTQPAGWSANYRERCCHSSGPRQMICLRVATGMSVGDMSFKKSKNENSPDTQRSKSHAPWEENGPQSGLYNSPNDRTKSPKFPCTRQRNLSYGSDNDSAQPMRRRSRSRCNTSSGSESENSNREHRKKRNRIRQENDMVDSAPQWEAVLRRQKEKTQVDPNNRRSRHRSRSKELVDPSGLSEEQLKEIPYTKVETQGDPVRIRHSHSPRSYRQYRRSQCSDGERSVLSEVNSKTDLVPPLPVTRSSDAQGSGGSTVHQFAGYPLLLTSL